MTEEFINLSPKVDFNKELREEKYRGKNKIDSLYWRFLYARKWLRNVRRDERQSKGAVLVRYDRHLDHYFRERERLGEPIGTDYRKI